MARFIPSDYQGDFHHSPGEYRVYLALSTLDDSYTVFYSLWWLRRGYKRISGGKDYFAPSRMREADFVVVHPNLGVVVIEVKSGGISHKDRQWYQHSFDGKTIPISPYVQAHTSWKALIDHIKQSNNSDLSNTLFSYCVWFTSIDKNELGDELPPHTSLDITLDRHDLAEPEQALLRVVDYFDKDQDGHSSGFKRPISADDCAALVSLLNPFFDVLPDRRALLDEQEAHLLQLTEEQSEVLDLLQRMRQAVIMGPAGSGKTILALEKARRLVASGKKVLLLCFTRLLTDSLSNKYSNDPEYSGVTINTAHDLAGNMLQRRYEISDQLKMLGAYLCTADGLASFNDSYDAVVVDEGQDQPDELLSSLEQIMAQKNGEFYVFYDPLQNILREDLAAFFSRHAEQLSLIRNCRNSAPICRTCAVLSGKPELQDNAVPGSKPIMVLFKDVEEQKAIAQRFIQSFADVGIALSDLALLTPNSIEKSTFFNATDIGGYTVSPKPEGNKVVLSTVRKFKGLEACCVLICDVSLWQLKEPSYRRKLYTGASRARSELVFAVRNDVFDLQRFLDKELRALKEPQETLEEVLERIFKVRIMSLEEFLADNWGGQVE